MPILQAQIETDRPSRYLVQFCKHAAAMGGAGGHGPRMHLQAILARREVQVAAEWSDTAGTVTFTPWGQCTLTAENGILSVRIDAADDDGLAQIRDVVTRDFERFTQRNPMTVTWQREPGAAPFRPADTVTSTQRRGPHRSRFQIVVLALAAVIVVGLHIGLAGAAIANSWWTGIATNVIVALVLLKIALIVLARTGIRRRRAAKTPDQA